MNILYSKELSNPLSITEAKAEILVISQFTLLASLKKGKNHLGIKQLIQKLQNIV